jgi:Lectin C-type domain
LVATLRFGLARALLGAGLVALFASAAMAEVIGLPIYNPESKSYFEFRNDNIITTGGTWIDAYNKARKLVYKGVRGRLAVVTTPETHNFLLKNFKIDDETWIGLRYWCKFRKLQWVTGNILDLGDFAIWGRDWDRQDGTVACQQAGSVRDGYMPVYYLPQYQGFRWQAVGASKKFIRYFVEYPTGAE